MIDITELVASCLHNHPIEHGLCIVFTPHTTTAITINENADPDVKSDLIAIFSQLVPRSPQYHHTEGNSDAHAKASLIGSSVMIPIESGKLALGIWQGILFCEFDGPRRREFMVQLISSAS